jgi:hypothetical protein
MRCQLCNQIIMFGQRTRGKDHHLFCHVQRYGPMQDRGEVLPSISGHVYYVEMYLGPGLVPAGLWAPLKKVVVTKGGQETSFEEASTEENHKWQSILYLNQYDSAVFHWGTTRLMRAVTKELPNKGSYWVVTMWDMNLNTPYSDSHVWQYEIDQPWYLEMLKMKEQYDHKIIPEEKATGSSTN